MIWYQASWSQELTSQMIARIARPGHPHPVYVHRILANHWYEQKRVARVEAKMADEADFISQLRTL